MKKIDKIAEFIELLNEEYVPNTNDKEKNFSNGEKVAYFWSKKENREKIKERLESDPKYEIGYETAKKIIAVKEIDKIAELIELLNEKYVPNTNDKEKNFSNGEKVACFWSNKENRKKIKERLETDSKYEIGYETAKKIIADKEIDKIAEFIEFLNEGYVPVSNDNDTDIEFSNGEKVNYFWQNNNEKIKERLESDPKYKSGYETAKKIIADKEIDKVAEFIEFLNERYVPNTNDMEKIFSNGEKVAHFWKKKENREKIKERLETDPKYENGYEIAKKIIADKEIDKMAEFIEFLNEGYVPVSNNNDTDIEFSNGGKVASFWNKKENREKIKERLETDPKYKSGYETAKGIIADKEIDKIAELIELLNERYIPNTKDKEKMFSNGGKVASFWKKKENREKIKERLETDSKYESGYETAKKIIRKVSILSLLKEKRKDKKKDAWNVDNILEYFNVDLEALDIYLNRTRKREEQSRDDVLYYKGMTLREFCIQNGYNYDVIFRVIKLKNYCQYDTLEQLINRAIISYNEKGQSIPLVWIYSAYGDGSELVKHILLYLNLDASNILSNMQKNIVTLEEAIRHDVFRHTKQKKENDWLEELYDYLIEEVDTTKSDEQIKEDLLVMAQILIQEYKLTPEEYQILFDSFAKYMNTIREYQKIDVGFEKNQKKKIEKIKEYNLDDDEIEESFYIPLEFDKNVLLGRKSELYKKRQLLRQYIIDWYYYSEEEKIKIVQENKFTEEEVKMIDRKRNEINQTLEEIGKTR